MSATATFRNPVNNRTAMARRAKITVTSGPDRGKTCNLVEDLARLGRSADNTLVLTDPDLAEYFISIMQREGRFAIFTNGPAGLEVDGAEVPAERWVWLPEQAQIRVSRRTELEFSMNGVEAAAEEPASEENHRRSTATGVGELPRPAAPRRAQSPTEESSGGSSRRKRGQKTRTVAKFITDGPGETLVKLGEDGHLPELMLSEVQARASHVPAAPKPESRPVLLYVALAASVALTAMMILLDGGAFGGNAQLKAQARREIVEYYGGEEEPLPYQVHLRQARQANSRGDFEAERREYRRVLDLLRSEAKDKRQRYTGLTGRLDYDPDHANKKSDHRLEELIGILLSE